MKQRFVWCAALASCLALASGVATAAVEIGQVKNAKGEVVVERDGATQPAVPGLRLLASDVVRTGADGSVGITMGDDSLLSLGPSSTLSLDRFEFDSSTQRGRFDASLRSGSLAVVSGRLAKQAPDAMTVRTPSTVLGVRGTEFAVSVHAPALAFVR
jgi:hypothetical protein